MVWIGWNLTLIICLSVAVSGNTDDHYDLNFKKEIENLENLLIKYLKCRKRYSIMGKKVIINLALLPMLYVFM